MSAISSRFIALLIRDPPPLTAAAAAADPVLDDMSRGSNFRDGDDCLLFRLFPLLLPILPLLPPLLPPVYRSAIVDWESTVILFCSNFRLVAGKREVLTAGINVCDPDPGDETLSLDPAAASATPS